MTPPPLRIGTSEGDAHANALSRGVAVNARDSAPPLHKNAQRTLLRRLPDKDTKQPTWGGNQQALDVPEVPEDLFLFELFPGPGGQVSGSAPTAASVTTPTSTPTKSPTATPKAVKVSKSTTWTTLSSGDRSARVMEATMFIAEGTAILPVVSTLVFGFAVIELFERVREGNTEEKKRLAFLQHLSYVMLALAVACSLYTTTYAVVESYYSKVLRSAFLQLRAKFSAGANYHEEYLASAKDISRKYEIYLSQFQSMRALARNALWASVSLLIVAQILEVVEALHGNHHVALVACICGALSIGLIGMLYTVYSMRSVYVPLCAEAANHVKKSWPFETQSDDSGSSMMAV